MKVLLICIVIFAIWVVAINISINIRIKNRRRMVEKYTEEIRSDIKKSGLYQYYDGLSTEELKNIYEELNNIDNSIDYKKDLYKLAEIGCKAELIEDIFDARGINIPEWK
ncbi:hypothetical protein [Clostridium beijerinckii]|uniref:hypothetical protein n=1 Tax=Clostridium beijerinckii TaxID=1520 RepID=UPI00156E09B7|nr:hypothetical protein [Clostridium beijerinckii]NRT73821.1 geranylgeranyl pyrophosphate synthase [Clostridium beijerinckii]